MAPSKIVESHLVLSLLKSSEQLCPLAVRTSDCNLLWHLSLPRRLTSRLLLSSHGAVGRLLEQQGRSSSKLLASLL